MKKEKRSFVGETIGYMHVLKEHSSISGNREMTKYDVFCDACKQVVQKTHHQLNIARWHAENEGKYPSCGCKKYNGFYEHNHEVDLVGKTFCNLLVIEEGPTITTGKDCKKRRTWKCLCECGETTYVTTGDLISGNTKSCGCLLSVGEKIIRDVLKEKSIDFVWQYTFDDLLTERKTKPIFDFAIFKNNELRFLLEYNGVQHYAVGNSWFGKMQREETDPLKKKYCEEKNITLFTIRYDENIEQKLNEILQLAYDDTVLSSTQVEKV